MKVAGWTCDRLRASRRPLACAQCKRVIADGAVLYVEDHPGSRYACSGDCAYALRIGRPAAALPAERLPFGDDSQSDADDPAF